MNAKKVTATILISSLLISTAGCGNRSDVLGKVREYADAVIAGRTEDIASCLKNDEDIDELEKYLSSCRTDIERNKIFDTILADMSYSIDSTSVKISDTEASVNITYTLPDYAVIYEDLDEGSGYTEYAEAINNNKDLTIEIRQTVELTMKRSEWTVVDNGCEDILEVYGFYEDITGFGWITATGEIGEFETALRNSLYFIPDSYTLGVYPNRTEAKYYFNNYAYFSCCQYDDPSEAQSEFEYLYDGYTEAMMNGGTWDGYSEGYSTTGEGEIRFNAHNECQDFLRGELYGGIYYNGDTIICIYTREDNAEERAMVDDLIDEIGLTPV